MALLIQYQQQHSQIAATATKSAMATAPSSSVHPANKVQQRQFEVRSATSHEEAVYQPPQALLYRKARRSRRQQQVNSVVVLSLPVSALVDQDGAHFRSFSSTNSDTVITLRQIESLIPPTAVRISAASVNTLQVAGEFSRDIIITQKIVSVNVINKQQKCNKHLASSPACDAVYHTLDWWNRVASTIPIDCSLRTLSSLAIHIATGVINISEDSTNFYFTLQPHQYAVPQMKFATIAFGSLKQHIISGSLRPNPYKISVERPPPWPPPTSILVIDIDRSLSMTKTHSMVIVPHRSSDPLRVPVQFDPDHRSSEGRCCD